MVNSKRSQDEWVQSQRLLGGLIRSKRSQEMLDSKSFARLLQPCDKGPFTSSLNTSVQSDEVDNDIDKDSDSSTELDADLILNHPISPGTISDIRRKTESAAQTISIKEI